MGVHVRGRNKKSLTFFTVVQTELKVEDLNADILASLQEIVVPLIQVWVLCYCDCAGVRYIEVRLSDSVWILAAPRQVQIALIIDARAEDAARLQSIKLQII